MSDTIEFRNARIKSTELGIEDHGILTFWLHLEYNGGGGQGAGGYSLDTPCEGARETGDFHREGTAYGMDFIKRVIETVGVTRWEELPGKYIRVKSSWNKVYAIAHPLKDNWLDFDEHYERWKNRL